MIEGARNPSRGALDLTECLMHAVWSSRSYSVIEIGGARRMAGVFGNQSRPRSLINSLRYRVRRGHRHLPVKIIE